MNVAVVVPYRPDGGHRDHHWAWLMQQWQRRFPDWDLRVGLHTDGEWCKAEAVNAALDDCDAEVLVIADADVWVDPASAIQEAAEQARTKPWVMPHSLVRRLTEAGSRGFINGQLNHRGVLEHAERPYPGVRGGGIVAITRGGWEASGGFDPRFKGWGQEDSAFARAADTLVGQGIRLTGELWHLWHPPAPRLNRMTGSTTSKRLVELYKAANGHPERIRALIAERSQVKVTA